MNEFDFGRPWEVKRAGATALKVKAAMTSSNVNDAIGVLFNFRSGMFEGQVGYFDYHTLHRISRILGFATSHFCDDLNCNPDDPEEYREIVILEIHKEDDNFEITFQNNVSITFQLSAKELQSLSEWVEYIAEEWNRRFDWGVDRRTSRRA